MKYYIVDGGTGDIVGTTDKDGWYPTLDKHALGGTTKYITAILLPEESETRVRIYDKSEVTA
tara:strand:+ start:427 stop:612 length:186 start_codon:yes stop_codon:yes gene_type:complete